MQNFENPVLYMCKQARWTGQHLLIETVYAADLYTGEWIISPKNAAVSGYNRINLNMRPTKPLGEKLPDPNRRGGNIGAPEAPWALNQEVQGPGGANGAPVGPAKALGAASADSSYEFVFEDQN